MWKLFLPLLFGVNMVHYWLITPDGSKFQLESPKWNVELHIPDGFDLPPLTHDTQSVYKQPGLQLKGVKVGARQVNLTLNLNAVSRDELHDLRSTLWRYVRWNTTTNDSPPDPLILRYENSGRQTDLFAYLLSENVTNLSDGEDKAQGASINLIAYDPMWYRVQATSPAWDDTDTLKTVTLNAQTALSPNYIVAKQNGFWSDMNTGTDNVVLALARGLDGSIYAGGMFANAGSGPTVVAGVAKWNGTAWVALGTGMNGNVNALAVAPNGDIYAGGAFTTAGGGAAQHIAKWNGAAWSAVGAGLDDDVYALAFDYSDGSLYAGGKFLNIAGGGSAVNHVAKWNGASWSALGTGADGDVFAVAVRWGYFGLTTFPTHHVFVGGSFTTMDGVSAANVAAWDGSTWAALGTGLEDGSTNTIYALIVGMDGTLYAGGNFNIASPTALSRIASWNGKKWYPLGNGVSAAVNALAIDNAGMLYVGGQFDVVDDTSIANVATWNGTSWGRLDLKFAVAPVVYALNVRDFQNVVIGYSTTTSAIGSGSTSSISQQGDFDAFPIFTITGPGTLQWLENVQAQKRITLSLYVNAGEIVTIDLSPGIKTITSNVRGNLMPYSSILPTSDFASFAIPPEPIAPNGLSTLNLMMTDITGATTITMKYREPFLSADGAVTP